MLPHAGSDAAPVAGLCGHGGVDAWGSFADGPPKSTGEQGAGCVERLLQSRGGCMRLVVPVLLSLLQHPLAQLALSAVLWWPGGSGRWPWYGVTLLLGTWPVHGVVLQPQRV